jgi:hypothetical protein
LYKKIFLLLFIAITAVNLYVYRNRNEYTYQKQSSYNELYPGYSSFTANKFNILNDSTIEIVVNNPSVQSISWQIKKDGQQYADYSGINPRIIVPKGEHRFTVFNPVKDSFSLQVENMSTDDYKKFNHTQGGGLLIFNSDLLQTKEVASLDKWKDDEVKATAEEYAAITSLLKDSMKISANETTIEKVKKIGCYLGFKLFPSRGMPSDSILGLSVFNQYKCGANGDPIWCGNYSLIFNLFALKAGIKTRNVEISKKWGSVPGNLHVFNEYYIPEQRKWAAIDLTFNNVFYIDKDGNLLNAVQVKNAGIKDSTIKVLRPHSATELIAERFDQSEALFFENYDPHNDLKYYLSLNYNESNIFYKKFLRYFQKKYYYEIYSDNSLVENGNFCKKQLFLLLQYIFTALFVLAILLKRIFKHD